MYVGRDTFYHVTMVCPRASSYATTAHGIPVLLPYPSISIILYMTLRGAYFLWQNSTGMSAARSLTVASHIAVHLEHCNTLLLSEN